MKAILAIFDPHKTPDPMHVIEGLKQWGDVHEIDVPEGAMEFKYLFTIDHPDKSFVTKSLTNTIPLPRPKTKVKKWIWEFTIGGWTWRTAGYHSEEEFDAESQMVGHKVLGSEIEVEE